MMKNKVIKPFLLSIALIYSVFVQLPVLAQGSLLLAGYPDEYTVKDTDTLWDIASQFLQDPQRWSEIWQPDPFIDNSELIYPGDLLSMSSTNNINRLLLKRGGRDVVNLQPEVREVLLSSAIPAIPLEAIENSFTRNRIIDPELYDNAPYIVSNLGDNLAIGTGDEVYVRGSWPAGAASFEIYRRGRLFTGESRKDILGLEIEYLGFATVSNEESFDLRRVLVNNSSREIRVGDRLLIREQSRIDATIFPTEPAEDLVGQIISFQGVETMASQLDTVVIDLGKTDNLVIGDILSIQHASTSIVDLVEREKMSFSERMKGVFRRDNKLELPGKEIGTLLVYRTFENLSYAVILSSKEPAQLYNKVASP
ncbi:MAG: hypothetical protein ACI95C_001894 [Pseudohongiellaceae bacterium]|jgi:hypothetical protein